MFKAVPTPPRPMTDPRAGPLTRPGGPVSPGSPCQKTRDRVSPQVDGRLLSPQLPVEPPETGVQPRCRTVTSPEVGRCYPGADMAGRSLLFLLATHPHVLYSPSSQKVPGVLRDQRDPRERGKGRGRVRVTHLGSEMNTNKPGSSVGTDAHPTPIKQCSFCHSPGHQVAQGLHGHPVGEKKSLVKESQSHPTREKLRQYGPLWGLGTGQEQQG